MAQYLSDDVLERVQRLRPIADGLGVSMAQLALAWVLRDPNVACPIVGASRPDQLRDNAGASGVKLDDATLRAIDDALALGGAGQRLVQCALVDDDEADRRTEEMAELLARADVCRVRDADEQAAVVEEPDRDRAVVAGIVAGRQARRGGGIDVGRVEVDELHLVLLRQCA